MEEKYLVINSGSSSVKFSLYGMPSKKVIAKGNVERIGKPGCSWLIKFNDQKIKGTDNLASHVEAVRLVIKQLLENRIINNVNEIKGVGHRVLHGASLYSESALIDDKVIEDIEALTPLGPLHHPGELAGIKCIKELFPNVANVAVFDTAFHQTMPKENYMYPVPIEWYKDYGVRRYGFHGTSHKYITEYMKEVLNREDPNLIVCHIGSGASISAIKNGKCYDTSMGLTPLDGLMMGTRSGGIDPSIIDYVARRSGKSVAELNRELNEESGLLGIAGKNDYRDIEKLANEGDERAKLALSMFVKSIVKYISQYYFELDGIVDGIIFTAGIGENSSSFRKLVIDEIKRPLGVVISDKDNNSIGYGKERSAGTITDANSNIDVFVVPTDEEKMILLDTYRIVKENEKEKTKHL